MYPGLLPSTDVSVKGVRVWSAQVDALAAAAIEELQQHLDSEERARAARFRFERDRQNYVVTRGLLRCLLGEILDEAPASLRFGYGPHGKPQLAGRPAEDFHFNLSHSSGWAMFAVAEGRAVGVDLESADRLDRKDAELAQLATRVLSVRELTIWKTLAPPEARMAFLRAWTRKEAYGKATGRGVFDALAGVEVILDATAPERLLILQTREEVSGLTNHWLIQDLAAPPGFSAALALADAAKEEIAGRAAAVFAETSHA